MISACEEDREREASGQKEMRKIQKVNTGFKTTFLQRRNDLQIASQHMKRRLQSPASREMQINTTIRYQFTPTKMTRIKNKLKGKKGKC